jgi:hypothetical protein
MPLGEIKPLQLTANEIYRLDRLSLLWYPDHADQLKHLSREDFLTWIYMIDPRSALIMAGYQEFRDILVYQKTKRWYHELRDKVWRKFYGVI